MNAFAIALSPNSSQPAVFIATGEGVFGPVPVFPRLQLQHPLSCCRQGP